MPPDIQILTEAWLNRDIAPLIEYCELIPDGAGGIRMVIDTHIWGLIMDELNRRGREARRLRQDMAARQEGFRDGDHALRKLADMPSSEAAPIYLRIFPPDP